MKNKRFTNLIVLAVVLTLPSVAMATSNIADNINAKLKLRPRVEVVDSEKSASAFTNCLQLEIEANNIQNIDGLSAVFEATKVTAVTDDFNSSSEKGGNLKADKATVIDPPITSFTKAYLRYKLNNTTFIVGEKPLNLDTQRFIGSVGWRQTPQTFGGFQ